MSLPTPQVALELRGVSAGYGGLPVLRDVDLRVEAGEFCGVVGPNGGGKSTLLKVVLGLLAPSRGSVTVFEKTPQRARGEMGYLPQDSGLDLAFPITVREVVAMGLLTPHARDWLPGRPRRWRAAVDAALEEAGLRDLASRHFGQLSGGQRERVLLSRATISHPRLLVLDEPTTGLDPQAASALHDQLAAIRDRGQIAVLMVSHDVAEVDDLAHRVISIDRGIEDKTRRPTRESPPCGSADVADHPTVLPNPQPARSLVPMHVSGGPAPSMALRRRHRTS